MTDRRERGEAPDRRLLLNAAEWLMPYREVARLLRLTSKRSAQLKRLGLVRAEPAGYRFKELVALRVASDLLESGATVRQIRQAVGDLKRMLPESEVPLAEIRLVVEGQKILAESDRVRFDPRTGQTVMVLDVGGLAAEARASLTRGMVRQLVPPQQASEAWFDRASELEEDPTCWDEAVEAYARVVAFDPTYVAAWNNLGLLQHRTGRYEAAGECYRKALEADSGCFQAPYNLGSLYEDLGDLPQAVDWYRRALALNPDYADAHFNLAGALARSGRGDEALRHWRRYLELDPNAPETPPLGFPGSPLDQTDDPGAGLSQ
ncbi:MAG: tetratricopeptide repeat protein [Candidatus Methylomirabilia bacterium]